ncbi:nicotinate-nucleotide pyrophosphorylase (carboxylating) [Clonorchis sinensis]|uniref:Nicotinate-nucleotide pyrophosphorylase (Carboxylating) n=1 Tax=Clonorchis sinensis TaxID=79923 RepID=G7YL87_CLOSI|nr:nicotinate-nucleotide pyrophosphorylase (carboxylating) [Clonorchis sinensis]
MASCTLNKELVRTLVSSWSCRETAINYFGIKSERRVLATVQMCSPGKIINVVADLRVGVLAGVPFVDALFKEFGCTVKWNVADGDVMVDHDLIVATVTGCLGDLLSCEKLAVSILSRASGITSYGRKIQLSGEIDEANLKTYALPCVDLLATSKLSNGYPLVMFRVTYGDDVAIEEESKLVEFPLTESPGMANKLERIVCDIPLIRFPVPFPRPNFTHTMVGIRSSFGFRHKLVVHNDQMLSYMDIPIDIR